MSFNITFKHNASSQRDDMFLHSVIAYISDYGRRLLDNNVECYLRCSNFVRHYARIYTAVFYYGLIYNLLHTKNILDKNKFIKIRQNNFEIVLRKYICIEQIFKSFFYILSNF